MEVPVDTNLDVTCSSEYKSYSYDNRHDMWALISLQAKDTQDHQRAPIDVVAVIDKSSSMRGEKLRIMKRTLLFILTQLSDKDRLSLVTYDQNPFVVLQLMKMTTDNIMTAMNKIEEIRYGLSTNLCGGLMKGLCQIIDRTADEKNEVASVLLFTDGMANTGISKVDGIIAAMKDPKSFNEDEGQHRSALTDILAFVGGSKRVDEAGSQLLVSPFNRQQQAPTKTKKPLEVDPFLCSPPNRLTEKKPTAAKKPFVVGLPPRSPSGRRPKTPTGTKKPFVVGRPPSSPSIPRLESPLGTKKPFVAGRPTTSPSNRRPKTPTVKKNPQPPKDESPPPAPAPAPAPAPTPEDLAKSKVADASVYTFGFGTFHNERMLKQISDAGNGMYYFIETEDTIAESFAHCLGGIMSTVAQGIQLNISMEPGVTIKEVHSTRPFEQNGERSLKVNIGDLQSEEKRDIVLELTIEAVCEPYETTPQPLLEANVDYFNVITKSLQTGVGSLAVFRPEEDDEHSDSNLNPIVSREKCRINMTHAMRDADRMATRGDYDGANKLLHQQVGAVKKSKRCISDLADSSVLQEFDAMADDLDECCAFATPEEWKTKGAKLQVNKMQQYECQRSSRPGKAAFTTKRKIQAVGASRAFSTQ